MGMLGVRAYILMLAWAVLGCGQQAPSGKQEDASAVAGPAIVDENYRFRLARPAGWKLLQARDIQEINPDALAGAVLMDAGKMGVVIVERAVADSLEGSAQLLVALYTSPTTKVESKTPIQLAGKPALRVVLTTELYGTPTRISSILFFHQGYAYELRAREWGSIGPDGNDITRFHAAFSLLPGKVTPRHSQRAVADTYGVGWRIRDGVFESAVSGLRIEPPDGWRLVVRRELWQSSDEAEVGLAHVGPDIFVAIWSSVVAPNLAANQMALACRSLIPTDDDVHTMTFLGDELALRVFESPEVINLRSLFGSHAEGNTRVHIEAWYVPDVHEQVLGPLREALGAITQLAPDERRALAGELGAMQHPQTAIAADYILRSGRYRDFGNGVMWKAPAGFWRIRVGDAAREATPRAALTMELMGQGITGQLRIDRDVTLSPRAYHARFVGDAPAERQPVGHHSGFLSRAAVYPCGTIPHDDLRVSTVGDGTGIMLWLSGPRAAMKRNQDAIETAIAGLGWFSGHAQGSLLGIYVDARLGYSLVPPAGWRRNKLAHPALVETGGITQWSNGTTNLQVMAMWNPKNLRSQFERRVADLFKDRFDPDEIVRKAVQVAGSPGERITAQDASDRLDVTVAHRQGASYMIIGEGPDREAIEAAVNTFTFIQ